MLQDPMGMYQSARLRQQELESRATREREVRRSPFETLSQLSQMALRPFRGFALPRRKAATEAEAAAFRVRGRRRELTGQH